MIKTFPGEIRVVFKNFPLLYHKQSELAALAALAAGEQGRFWEMHNKLFKDQNSISMSNILNYVEKLKLDVLRFKKDLKSKELKGMIDRDKAEGTALGVSNIPTTFINGKKLVGSPPVSRIKEIIESIIKTGK
jgi:protein-disulfide isomerase